MVKAVIFDLYETLVTEFDPELDFEKRDEVAYLGVDEAAFKKEWIDRRKARMTGESYKNA